MKSPFVRFLLKSLKITSIVVGAILLLMFILPVLFPQTITNKIEQLANKSINGKVTFSGTDLSFFKRFPALTLTLNDFSLKGSAPFQNDTLIAAKEVSFALDLSSLLRTDVKISKIYLNQATINIEVDSTGHANYNVYKAQPASPKAKADTTSASLGIDEISIVKSHLMYNDASLPMKINARNFNYSGSGNLSKDVFDLYTHTEIASFDFSYNNQPYIINKKVNADLVTNINTKSLAFVFQKNDLMINQLPVKFNGKFGFVKDGYDMDFKLTSYQSDLSDIFTALPSKYSKLVDNIEVNGTGTMQMALKGQYSAAKKLMPDFDFSMKVRDGYIASNKTPSPVKNLYLNLTADVKGCNPDNLDLNMDSLHFNVDNDFFNSKFKLKGIKSPQIYAKINTEIDLEKWCRATGIKFMDLGGRYKLNLLADGRYATGIAKTGLRSYDTVITSVPKFSLSSSFNNGYIKFANLPEALKNIHFNLNAQCPDNNYKHIRAQLSDFNINALSNYIKGYLIIDNENGIGLNGDLKANVHLSDIKSFYPVHGADLQGDVNAVLTTRGHYIAKKHIFPVTNASIDLVNGYIKTSYYPHPIEKLQISTSIINKTGTLAGMKVNIKPISFAFEGQPFWVKADLKNFSDLNYNIQSHGVVNIGKIYQVFALKGYNASGLITTNLSLKGRQSYAIRGQYDKLFNSGNMTVKDLVLRSDLFPKPFIVKDGLFTFNQDKMNFDKFRAVYGKSVIVLNGALSNVLNYVVKPGACLTGNFDLKSHSITADDFMAFANAQPASTPSKPAPAGVILVPSNLNLNFKATVDKIKYNGLNLNNFSGQLAVDSGKILLKKTGFTLINAPVTMDGSYRSITPQKAAFDYHLTAKSFDIKKAYKEIKLFRDMATSASSAEGIVSLDYQLSGKLNKYMYPVYPSLKGGGVLSLERIKVKGLKLFGAIGKQTGRNSMGKGGDLSKVDIKTTIANNIITIAQTKMRFAGFRPRFGGQVGFNGDLNLKFRLGLPPLGIFGIPMTITGTEQKPKIRLGNGKKEDELKQEADVD